MKKERGNYILENRFYNQDRVIVIQKDYNRTGQKGIIIEVIDTQLKLDNYPYRVQFDDGDNDVFESTGIKKY